VSVGGIDRLERLLQGMVLDIRNGSVRLGFEADPDIPVHRQELWERIRAEGLTMK
jgi:carbon storage regulator CsrA